MTVSSNGTPALVASNATLTPSVTTTFPTGSSPLVNHLMLAVVGGYSTTTAPIPAAPAGWTLWNSVQGVTLATGAAAVTTFTAYYVKTATGSDSAPVFTSTFTGTAADAGLAAVVYDLSDTSGQTPILFTDGKGNLPAAGPVALFTAGPAPAGSLGIVSQRISQGTTAAVNTWTAPSTGSWNACTTNETASARSQFGTFWTSAAPATGNAMTASITHSRTATQCPTIAIVVAPPGSAGVQLFQAVPYWGNNASGTTSNVYTSVAFTLPQAAGLLVATAGVGNGAGTTAATSLLFTDNAGSGSGSWLARATELGNSSSGAAAVAVKDVSAAGSTTVTATVLPSTTTDLSLVVYWALAAAVAASQNGGHNAANALTTSVTPVSTGGVIVGGAGADSSTAFVQTATTLQYPSEPGPDGDVISAFAALAVTAATVAQTLGFTGPATASVGIAAAEIIPAPSAPAAGGIVHAAPGVTWLRQFHHPQALQAIPSQVVAAAAPVLTWQSQPVRARIQPPNAATADTPAAATPGRDHPSRRCSTPSAPSCGRSANPAAATAASPAHPIPGSARRSRRASSRSRRVPGRCPAPAVSSPPRDRGPVRDRRSSRCTSPSATRCRPRGRCSAAGSRRTPAPTRARVPRSRRCSSRYKASCARRSTAGCKPRPGCGHPRSSPRRDRRSTRCSNQSAHASRWPAAAGASAARACSPAPGPRLSRCGSRPATRCPRPASPAAAAHNHRPVSGRRRLSPPAVRPSTRCSSRYRDSCGRCAAAGALSAAASTRAPGPRSGRTPSPSGHRCRPCAAGAAATAARWAAPGPGRDPRSPAWHAPVRAKARKLPLRGRCAGFVIQSPFVPPPSLANAVSTPTVGAAVHGATVGTETGTGATVGAAVHGATVGTETGTGATVTKTAKSAPHVSGGYGSPEGA